MDLAGLLVFASALFIAAASPGPGIAAIVARVLGRGTRGALAFTAGVALGDVVWLTVAILGLSALAQAFHGVFEIVKYAGAAYLLYLAWRLWTAPVAAHAIALATAREKPAPAVPRRARRHHGQPQGHGVLPRAPAGADRHRAGDGRRLRRARRRDARRARDRVHRLRRARLPGAAALHLAAGA